MNLRDYKLAGLKNTKFKVRFHGFYFSKLSRRHEPTQKKTAENSEETTRMAASGIDSMKSCQVSDHSSTRSLFPGKSITLRFTRLSHLLTQKKLHTLTLITLDIIITYAKELKSCWSFPRVSCCKTEAVRIKENRKTDYSENIISLQRTLKLRVTDKLSGRFSFQRNCGVASVGEWNTKIWYQTTWRGSNFHRKKIWKLTFRAFALRRHFPIRLRRWRFKRSSGVVTFRLGYEDDVLSVRPASSLSD